MPYYMKAYPIEMLRAFEGWKEREGLSDDQIVFLRQDLTVTRTSLGIAADLVFDEVSDEWRAFCREKLKFELPDWAASSGSGQD